jgi:ribosomal-protein-alanine N-acetyltransferase
LTCESLALRPPQPADAAALLAFELENRAWFERWVHPRDPAYYRLDAVQAAIEQAASERRAEGGYQYLALAGDGRIVGRVNLRSVRGRPYRSAELGYRIGERDAGRGFASAAVALCLHEAFGAHGLWRVEATARPINRASIRVLERCGFTAWGRSARCVEFDGEWFDLIHFERHADAA